MGRKNGGISERLPAAENDSLRRSRGRYYKPTAPGTNFVLLDPDVAVVFRDPESVNQVLRSLIGIAGQVGQITLTPVVKASISRAVRSPANKR